MNEFDLFGKNVLKDEYIEKHLSKDEFKEYKRTIQEKMLFNYNIANKIAEVIKKWAIENGATHYTHWFQPLNGITAEKHISFLSTDLNNNLEIEFPIDELILGETDASSFPSGGLRSVFEARGNTKWDYTYPIFLKENSNGKVLCIPTMLFSSKGESLDKRTPLINSCEALNKQILRILKIFGDNKTEEIYSTVGAEQEYFLVRREDYKKRKDLMITGKTLFGRKLPLTVTKHYMNPISEKTGIYMKKVEEELWKLGIPAKVKHNEVSVHQYELVPQFEKIYLSANNDFLIMEILQREAKKCGFACLLHEKPFEGMNGSGKHNNWSIYKENGENLFIFGENNKENLRFLCLTVALISAIDKHSDLIRATVATSGNDMRLSGYEAPSSIVSVYLGEELTSILDKIRTYEKPIDFSKIKIPKISNNITDRNRTSPFAYIGNRFEFRMPGAYASITVCNTVLNTIMAESLEEIAQQLEHAKNFNKELQDVLRKLLNEHFKIIYNGNAYSEEWEKEAESRSLRNVSTAPEAFNAFIKEESIELFQKYNIYTRKELLSRYKIKLEKYMKNIHSEATIMVEMIEREILPKCIEYAKFLGETIEIKQKIKDMQTDVEQSILAKVSDNMKNLYRNVNMLKEYINKDIYIEDLYENAMYYATTVKQSMQVVRKYADNLETIIPENYWPFPTYINMLLK